MKSWSWHFISDVHIKSPSDSSEKLLMSFLTRSLQDRSCEKIFLCGDIFDLMIGSFEENKFIFSKVFDEMKKLLHSGKDIYYIEGNHDFLLKDFLKSIFTIDKEFPGTFHFSDEFFYIKKNKVSYLVCHGDTIEINSGSYPLYKSFITSRFMKLFVENLISFNFLERIGRAASQKSRDRGEKAYGQMYNEEAIKTKFRESVLRLSNHIDFNFLICGHSHVKDDIQLKEHVRYLNNGYAPLSKSFIRISESGATFESLI